jgi:hypothetical protein
MSLFNNNSTDFTTEAGVWTLSAHSDTATLHFQALKSWAAHHGNITRASFVLRQTHQGLELHLEDITTFGYSTAARSVTNKRHLYPAALVAVHQWLKQQPIDIQGLWAERQRAEAKRLEEDIQTLSLRIEEKRAELGTLRNTPVPESTDTLVYHETLKPASRPKKD